MEPNLIYLAVWETGGVGSPVEDEMDERKFSFCTCEPSPFRTATGFHAFL